MDYGRAERIALDLVAQMTPYEKLSQLLNNSPAIDRLGIKEYNWWNEAAHGVARAGTATVFPQAIGMGATFNPELIERVATAVSVEARAKYNQHLAEGDRGIYKGLTFWTPNINIFRDPRWGRGQETFGEDPFLTSELGTRYVHGLQGDGTFLRSAACAKHFAAHSAPEGLRHCFDAQVTQKDLWETYLPAFEKLVKAGVVGVMGAYNRTNGEPCCAHSYLMQKVLQDTWHFQGYFVSDCGAISFISQYHGFAPDLKHAAAIALQCGCHLNCGEAYAHLIEAYEEDLITEQAIDTAVTRLYTVRAALGEFETQRPYADLSADAIECPAHLALNLETAQQSLVLLKNQDGFLPLNSEKLQSIAVIGPTADSPTVLEGNYNGTASEYVTPVQGIRRTFPHAAVTAVAGSPLWQANCAEDAEQMRAQAVQAAKQADVTVLCLGLDRDIEGEALGIEDEYACFGDRKTLSLPAVQLQLAQAVCSASSNVIVVVLCGSSVDLGDKINAQAKALIHGWYPGSLGGLAIARLLIGAFSPSGKLPVTFYKQSNMLPDITDYSMQGRTYRYLTQQPLYPFGFGLGFATVKYESAQVIHCNAEQIGLRVRLTNQGNIRLCEKIQIYASFTDSRTATPQYQLCGLKAVTLHPDETIEIDMEVDTYWLRAVLESGEKVTPNGGLTLFVGGHQPDALSERLSGSTVLRISVS